MTSQKYDSSLAFRHNRQSTRLQKHDYSWTRAYFVTTCADVREPIFEIPELHTILKETWEGLPQRFAGVTLDEFVIMPDHIHFIIWLNGLVKDAPTLGRVIGAYKSLTTVAWLRYIEATKMECSGRFWQRNYFERVIRDNEELEKTRQYIRDNPDQGDRKGAPLL